MLSYRLNSPGIGRGAAYIYVYERKIPSFFLKANAIGPILFLSGLVQLPEPDVSITRFRSSGTSINAIGNSGFLALGILDTAGEGQYIEVVRDLNGSSNSLAAENESKRNAPPEFARGREGQIPSMISIPYGGGLPNGLFAMGVMDVAPLKGYPA